MTFSREVMLLKVISTPYFLILDHKLFKNGGRSDLYLNLEQWTWDRTPFNEIIFVKKKYEHGGRLNVKIYILFL
jgi:hypothetical protein